jgi:transposase
MPDVNEVRKAQSELLNELYKQISKSFNYQLQHGVVYLAKKGVSVTEMARAFGLTPARIYQIIDRFDRDGIDVLGEQEKSDEQDE